MADIIVLDEHRSRAPVRGGEPRGPAEITLFTGVTRTYDTADAPSPTPAPEPGTRRKRRKAS